MREAVKIEERLQKLIASAGLCSRRTAEDWINLGCVTVNGEVAALGTKADAEKDCIEINGKEINFTEEKVYLMLHKPRGCVTTLSDERGRDTAAELVGDCGRRVYPVGRLDYMSEGLLLFTNDGAFMQAMLHPSNEVNKTYHVEVSGEIGPGTAQLRAMRSLDGEPIAPAEVELLHRSGRKALLSITIHEGKNRQIRRMCAAAGLQVSRLIRVAEHGLALGALPVGKWRYLTEEELKHLPVKGGER